MARCLSKHPPHKESSHQEKQQQKQNKKSKSVSSNSTVQNHKSNRFKNTRKKEWKRDPANPTQTIIQPSTYYFKERRRGEEQTSTIPRMALLSLDSSALLNPLQFCKVSAKTAQSHGVSQSISGTDAARRLLRGKRDFLKQARGLNSPALLRGHGVPPALLSHFIDMADALMLQYGNDAVEATFHNYNNSEGQLPSVLRVRSRDATNACFAWPPTQKKNKRLEVEWDYHITLYLTVMERLAKTLGLVLQKKNKRHESDDDDFVSSSLLFPSNQTLHWNVDLLRGSYFDLSHVDGKNANADRNWIIVEFSNARDDTQTTNGHVLIRLQGCASPNADFNVQHSRKPVTLVFDACCMPEHETDI
jgi:hypothetical protein